MLDHPSEKREATPRATLSMSQLPPPCAADRRPSRRRSPCVQTFVRRNSVYVATIILGAFAGEMVRRSGVQPWQRQFACSSSHVSVR